MQKCGQLHASIAVALIAQSAVAGEEWPTLMESRAMTASNAVLCITEPPVAGQYAPRQSRSARGRGRMMRIGHAGGVESRTLSRQQRHTCCHQRRRNPTPSVHLLVQEDFRSDGVADEG